MLRSSIVIMIVLLSYVSVLNFVVVSYLYRQFSAPATPTSRVVHASPVRRAADAVHRMVDKTAAGASEAHNAADAAVVECPAQTFTDMAVRVRSLTTGDSNDAAEAPSVRLLANLRQRLLAGKNEHVRVWLVIRPEDFVALLRMWCVALGVDTRGRCQCEVLFTEPAQHQAIAWLVAHRQPCLQRLFLLDEAFQVPPRAVFSAELLARAGPDAARLQLLDASPAPAGRESLLLPGCFLRECVRRRCRIAPGLERDADLAVFAASARAGLVCRLGA